MYFLYPETSGVRLEDMDQLFGDATTAMPTPATQGERGSLMGVGSPVPSLDLRRNADTRYGPEYAIPGLDIEPPSSIGRGDKIDEAERGERSTRREGIGGWISNMVNRGKDARNRGEGRYRRLDQDEED